MAVDLAERSASSGLVVLRTSNKGSDFAVRSGLNWMSLGRISVKKFISELENTGGSGLLTTGSVKKLCEYLAKCEETSLIDFVVKEEL
jgi:hypothetical protein